LIVKYLLLGSLVVWGKIALVTNSLEPIDSALLTAGCTRNWSHVMQEFIEQSFFPYKNDAKFGVKSSTVMACGQINAIFILGISWSHNTTMPFCCPSILNSSPWHFAALFTQLCESIFPICVCRGLNSTSAEK